MVGKLLFVKIIIIGAHSDCIKTLEKYQIGINLP